ncbi:hypothetical protein L21SP2_0189 [Salinispira pacifica]|uniref:Uncharacterized protein n=1 Tax=Salinispira pacifica TaxID=1307761 RepID=V5WCU6_9SPIO|nr:hypothetical protein L21SP2_0189 [Salinispira pacifica]
MYVQGYRARVKPAAMWNLLQDLRRYVSARGRIFSLAPEKFE